MLSSSLADIRSNRLHNPNRYVVHWMRIGRNDKWDPSFYGRLTGRSTKINYQNIGNTYRTRGERNE